MSEPDGITYDEIALAVENPLDTQADTAPPLGDFEYSCEVCGVELKYGGRGRKPTKCKQHKAGSTRAVGPSTARASRWQQPLAEALNAQFVGIGLVTMAFDPFDGQIIMKGAPALSESLIRLAEANPSVRRGLEQFVTAGAWSGVAMAVASIAMPIMMHHRIIPTINLPGMGPVV